MRNSLLFSVQWLKRSRCLHLSIKDAWKFYLSNLMTESSAPHNQKPWFENTALKCVPGIQTKYVPLLTAFTRTRAHTHTSLFLSLPTQPFSASLFLFKA